MKNKRYSREIRGEVLGKIQAGKTVAAVSAEYGIHQTTVRNWLSRDTGGRSGEILEVSRLKRENEELLRLVGILTYESETGKKTALVSESTEQVSKTELARRLGVSRSSLYYRSKLPEKDDVLRREIEALMELHPGYGHRRVAYALQISRGRARRVMKKYHLKPARRAKAPRKPLDFGREPETFSDVTAVLSPCTPHVVWVSDFTYICYRGVFLYLATILDLFTGEVLAAQIMTSHAAELIQRTLIAAILRTGCIPEWLHSDQGSEYISEEVRGILRLLEINISMSPKKSPWRNGSQESFFGRFKVEFGDPERFDCMPDLVAALYQHINYFSNLRIKNRLRMPPAEFKKRWLEKNPNYEPRKLNSSQIIQLRQKSAAIFAF